MWYDVVNFADYIYIYRINIIGALWFRDIDRKESVQWDNAFRNNSSSVFTNIDLHFSCR